MKKESNALKTVFLLLAVLLLLTAFPATAFAAWPPMSTMLIPVNPPAMTASFKVDGSVEVKTNDSTYAQKITNVKINGEPLPNAFDELCQVTTSGSLYIDSYCFQQQREYSITIIATGYRNATVTVSNIPANPPVMAAAFQADGSVVVMINDNTYAQKITNVKINGKSLPSAFDELCQVINGNLYIDSYCFQLQKEYSITVIASGYRDAVVTASNITATPPATATPETGSTPSVPSEAPSANPTQPVDNATPVAEPAQAVDNSNPAVEPAQPAENSDSAVEPAQQELRTVPFFIWIIIGILAGGLITLIVILIMKKGKA